MNRKRIFLAMLVCLSTLSLIFTSCDLLIDDNSFSWSEVNGTTWIKNGGAWINFSEMGLKLVSIGFPDGNGEYKSNSYVDEISGSKIKLRDGVSFNVSVSEETLTISNWSSVAVPATIMNGNYTKK